MKEKITTFIHGLISYDYILFGSVFALFILLIILTIVLRRKLKVALFLLLLAFSILFLGPSLGYVAMHHYLYKNSLTLLSQKRLHFSDAIVVKGRITNESKFDFSRCIIRVDVHKNSKNKLKKFLYKFNTIQQMSILKRDIRKGKTVDFKVIVEPFKYKKDYFITLGAKCK